MSEDGFPDYFDEPNMEIQIDTLTGTSFDMRVSATDTIREIKQRIQRVEGIPIHQQNLIFQSKELKDSGRLCDAGIKNGSTIKLVLAMRGGPISTRRLSISCEHHLMLKELKELLENTRDEIGDRLAPGSKVSVLVFKEGEILNLLRVIENEDGSYSPYNEKPISPPSRRLRDRNITTINNLYTTSTTTNNNTINNSDICSLSSSITTSSSSSTSTSTSTSTSSSTSSSDNEIFEKLVEDTDMMTKVSNLRKRMDDINNRRQLRHNRDDNPLVSINNNNLDDNNNIINNNICNNKNNQSFLPYKLLSSTDLLDNLKIYEKDEEECHSEEEIALKDKHRVKTPRNRSIYNEYKGLISHTKQHYIRLHKKQQQQQQTTNKINDQLKRNTVQLTRLILDNETINNKDDNKHNLWEWETTTSATTTTTAAAAADRLNHSTTSCKFGLLNTHTNIDYNFNGIDNSTTTKTTKTTNGGGIGVSGAIGGTTTTTTNNTKQNEYEIYATNYFKAAATTKTAAAASTTNSEQIKTTTNDDSLDTSTTTIPTQNLNDFYFNRPLYGRRSEHYSDNFLSECTIQRLKNDCETNDLLTTTSTTNRCLTNTNDNNNNNNNSNIEELYGYYNFGCTSTTTSSSTLNNCSKTNELFTNNNTCSTNSMLDEKKIRNLFNSAGTIKTTTTTTTTSDNKKTDFLPPVMIKKKSRCNECNKRLNITNIYNCRCGKIFCSQHRYSEVHHCNYDYKSEGRKILEHQNPLVTADKINNRI